MSSEKGAKEPGILRSNLHTGGATRRGKFSRNENCGLELSPAGHNGTAAQNKLQHVMESSLRPRVTHQDIADHLGISRVSVTQALHQTRRSTLSPELQARVLEAACTLNYRPRNVATYTIGYVGSMRTFALAAESQYLMALDEALRQAGYRILLANARDGDLEPLRALLTPKTVDGVIFSRWFEGRVRDVLPPEIPWIVTSDEDGIGDGVDQVTMDTRATAEHLARYLLRIGHRRIALVTGPGDRHYHGHLKDGLRAPLPEAGLAAEIKVIEVRHDREITAALRQLLHSSAAPTAIIAASPEKTIAALNLLNASGYRVPQDVSVVSFIDSRLFEPLTPQITATTAGQHSIKYAAQRLVEKINNPSLPARRVLHPGEIIERESVAPPRNSG
jgi:DNA-binding LacI/PurR family transcriptional regulator